MYRFIPVHCTHTSSLKKINEGEGKGNLYSRMLTNKYRTTKSHNWFKEELSMPVRCRVNVMKNHRIFTYFKEIPDINNKDLLHSTGNYIQLLVINYNGRESEKETDHFAVHLKLAQPCKLTTCSCSVAQSCPTLCDPMDCKPPDSSVHRLLQGWILEWIATSSSRGSSDGQMDIECPLMWCTRKNMVLVTQDLPRKHVC